MDQRNAGSRSPGPLEPGDAWGMYARDQLAVLDGVLASLHVAARGYDRVRRYDVAAMASEYARLYRSSLPREPEAAASSSQ